MIFCGSASATAAGVTSSVEVSTVSGGRGPAGASTGASATGAGSSALGGSTASGVARIREIGGRNVRFVFPPSSRRFARGFFSSIKESVSFTGFVGAGGAAAAATVSVATRALEATAAADARPAFVAGSAFAFDLTSFRFGAATSTGAAALTGFRVEGVVFRAAVLVVVRVGIVLVKNLRVTAMREAFALLCDSFLVHRVVDFLRFRLVD